jgi:hypothetical protein
VFHINISAYHQAIYASCIVTLNKVIVGIDKIALSRLVIFKNFFWGGGAYPQTAKEVL